MFIALPLPAALLRWTRQSRTPSPSLPYGDLGPPINQIYHARRLSLVRLAALTVGDLPTAEDVVQDVFATMYRRHGADLRGLDEPDAYLTTAVMNASRSVLRRRRVAHGYIPAPPDAAPAAEDQALLGHGEQRIWAALQLLTARQRQVVVLRYWSELSEREIADTLQVSSGTVKSTASRALDILRHHLRGKP